MSGYHIAAELYTLAKTGKDGTIRHDHGDLPESGYYIGSKFPSFVVESVQDIDRGELAWWAGSHEAEYYGVWKDIATGKIYFDGTDHRWGLDYALRLAALRNEIAIWDIAKGEEIRVVAQENSD